MRHSSGRRRLRKPKSEGEAAGKKQAKEAKKLASALVGIEILKKEVHLSQREVASLTKQVET